jgi:hypothetical protein
LRWFSDRKSTELVLLTPSTVVEFVDIPLVRHHHRNTVSVPGRATSKFGTNSHEILDLGRIDNLGERDRPGAR